MSLSTKDVIPLVYDHLNSSGYIKLATKLKEKTNFVDS